MQEAEQERWLTLQANLGLAPNTLVAYRRALEEYAMFCACRQLEVRTATREHIALYVRRDRRRRPCAPVAAHPGRDDEGAPRPCRALLAAYRIAPRRLPHPSSHADTRARLPVRLRVPPQSGAPDHALDVVEGGAESRPSHRTAPPEHAHLAPPVPDRPGAGRLGAARD